MPEQFPTLIQRLNAIETPVTAKTLAGLLGVSHITVYKQAAKGIIPSFRIATAVRFDTRRVPLVRTLPARLSKFLERCRSWLQDSFQ